MKSTVCQKILAFRLEPKLPFSLLQPQQGAQKLPQVRLLIVIFAQLLDVPKAREFTLKPPLCTI
ncbi:MAG TPA: hypothetical protein VIV60_30430 [Polyangiaceae bacterium]